MDVLEIASEPPARASCVLAPTALYRHWDQEGKLLYVGVSLSPTYRLSQHKDASPWFGRIANITVEWFETRLVALEAERLAIKAEAPEFNVVHKPKSTSAYSQYLEEQVEESCAELTRKVSRFGATYTVSNAAATVGVGVGNMRLALVAGDLPYFIAGKTPVITGWALIAYLEALQAGVAKVRVRTRNQDGSYPPYPRHDELADRL